MFNESSGCLCVCAHASAVALLSGSCSDTGPHTHPVWQIGCRCRRSRQTRSANTRSARCQRTTSWCSSGNHPGPGAGSRHLREDTKQVPILIQVLLTGFLICFCLLFLPLEAKLGRCGFNRTFGSVRDGQEFRVCTHETGYN